MHQLHNVVIGCRGVKQECPGFPFNPPSPSSRLLSSSSSSKQCIKACGCSTAKIVHARSYGTVTRRVNAARQDEHRLHSSYFVVWCVAKAERCAMNISTSNLVPVVEANQNCSRIACFQNENGAVTVLRIMISSISLSTFPRQEMSVSPRPQPPSDSFKRTGKHSRTLQVIRPTLAPVRYSLLFESVVVPYSLHLLWFPFRIDSPYMLDDIAS